jgi:hypothetical protein
MICRKLVAKHFVVPSNKVVRNFMTTAEFVEVMKAITPLGTIVVYAALSNLNLRLHERAAEKRFSDMLASAKEAREADGKRLSDHIASQSQIREADKETLSKLIENVKLMQDAKKEKKRWW